MSTGDKVWHVLNYIAPSFSRRGGIEFLTEHYNRLYNLDLEVFAPKFTEMVMVDGRWIRKERPLMFHYIFVRGRENDVKNFCSSVNGMSFVINRAGEKRHLIIDDNSMKSFRNIARFYGNDLPCFVPSDIDLEDGDLVEVVNGDFAGVQGRFISRKGSRSGQVCIALNDSLCAMICDIKADYVKVLEYAKGSKRGYDQLDAHIPRLLKALEEYKQKGECADASLIAPMIVFCRRMSDVKSDSQKFNARLRMLLAASCKLIGDEASYALYRAQYAQLQTHITNPWTAAFGHYLFGILDEDAEEIEKARNLIAGQRADTSLRRTLISLLS